MDQNRIDTEVEIVRQLGVGAVENLSIQLARVEERLINLTEKLAHLQTQLDDVTVNNRSKLDSLEIRVTKLEHDNDSRKTNWGHVIQTVIAVIGGVATAVIAYKLGIQI